MSSPQLKWIEHPPTIKQTLDSQLATSRDKPSVDYAQPKPKSWTGDYMGVKKKSELAVRLGQPLIKEPHASHLYKQT